MPGLAIGGKLVFARNSIGDDYQNAWGIGPQLLYFFGGEKAAEQVKGTMYPYLGVSFIYTKSSSKDFSGKEEISGRAFSLGGGASYMLSNSVGLFGEASYELDKMESVSGNKFNIIAGFLIFL